MKAPERRAPIGTDDAFDMTSLTRLFGFKIGLAYSRTRRLFKRRMSALQLTTLDYSILSLLTNREVHQARLSVALSVPPQNLTAVLERLEARGLVARVPSENDRRAQIVGLTEAGLAFLDRAHTVISVVERDLLEPLTPGEQAIFGELLAKLSRPLFSGTDEAAREGTATDALRAKGELRVTRKRGR